MAGALPRAALRLPRRARLLLFLVVFLAAGLGALYLAWFRHSSLVRVEHVKVTGLTTSDAGRVRAALVDEARSMTTLDLDRARLVRAVAAFPVVRSIEVSTDFPHALRIHVVERTPAARLVGSGGSVIVAGDGTVLTGVDGSSIPVLQLPGKLPSKRLTPHSVPGREVAVAGAAPPALRARVQTVTDDQTDGLVAEIENGPRIIFGGVSRVRAKWMAAAAVLADESSKGATYVDVQLPERPVAGGLAAATIAPMAPAGGSP